MGRSRYKIYEEDHPYFITSSVKKWNPVFNSDEASQVILDCLLSLQNKRHITLYAYVIMKNHIHIIASGKNLPEKIKLFKSYTARKIIDSLESQNDISLLKKLPKGHKSNFRLWQEGMHTKQLMNDKMMTQKIKYIHGKPVRAEYVDKPEKWDYSSIHNYLTNSGLIPVSCYQREQVTDRRKATSF